MSTRACDGICFAAQPRKTTRPCLDPRPSARAWKLLQLLTFASSDNFPAWSERQDHRSDCEEFTRPASETVSLWLKPEPSFGSRRGKHNVLRFGRQAISSEECDQVPRRA